MSDVYSVEYSNDTLGDLLSKLARLDRAQNLDEFRGLIPPLLASVGRYTNADRAYVFTWADASRADFVNSFEWCAEGVAPQIGNLQKVPASLLPYWLKSFARDEAIVIPDLEAARETMPAEYEILATQSIRSLIAFPIFTGTELDGFVGVDNPSEASRETLAANILLAVGGHLGSLNENLRARQELESLAEEARRANFAKTDFLRRMSHDIRTPLNGIRGMIEIANRCPDDPDRQQECRDKIWNASSYLLSLVSNVLDMSKLESGTITLERRPFSLRALLDELNSVAAMQAQEKGVNYLVDTAADAKAVTHWNLVGSPIHLKQILMNIGLNAVKYTPAGGFVQVRAEEREFDGTVAMYRFTCTDTGIGMGKEFQPRAFEPYTQEQRSDLRNNAGGSGLGLAIVKALVDRMGGAVSLESAEGAGTTFTIDLAFEVDLAQRSAGLRGAPALSPLAARARETGDAAGKSVLLVEDNELNMEIARFFFEHNGVKVEGVGNGRRAVEAFEASAPGDYDAIFMDVMMPVMDGLAATRAIRALPRPDAATIPIFAMTANAFTDDVRRSLEAGMNGHIVKPLEERKLMDALLGRADNR